MDGPCWGYLRRRLTVPYRWCPSSHPHSADLNFIPIRYGWWSLQQLSRGKAFRNCHPKSSHGHQVWLNNNCRPGTAYFSCATSLDANIPKGKVPLCSYFTKQKVTQNSETLAQDGRTSMRKVGFKVLSPISEALGRLSPPNTQAQLPWLLIKSSIQGTEPVGPCAKPPSHSRLASWACDLCNRTGPHVHKVPVLCLMFRCYCPEILNNFTFEFVIFKWSPME